MSAVCFAGGTGKDDLKQAVLILAPHDTPGFRNALLADPQGPVFLVTQLTGRW